MRIAAGLVLMSMVSIAGADDAFPDDWFFYGADRPAELRALEGKKAKDFSAAEWRGDAVDLADTKGKVVVLDFWATWCGPCMAAIPKNIEMVEQYEDDGLVFMGIHDSNSGWDKVDAVINDKGINYPVALDDAGASTKAYNLKFWPTYVVIDRNGIVRAAGMAPGHVEEAVKILLAEPYAGAPAKAAPKAGSFPDEFFFGGEKRPSWLRVAEGKKLKSLEAEEWVGKPVDAKAWQRKVLVVQFVHPTFGKSFEQLASLTPTETKYGRQGVVFAAVCDARGDWDAAEAEIEERELTTPMAFDVSKKDGEVGEIAKSFGVRFAQPLAVVDRAGVIRAVGLDPKHLEKVLNTLLAEPMPPAPESTTQAGS